jgi:outer membrane protein TolC
MFGRWTGHARGVAFTAAAAFAAASLGAPNAHALQPLSEFLARAEATSTDARLADANADEKDAEAAVALGHLLPALSARGVYTRNQEDISFPFPGFGTVTILKLNQLDAYFELDVPIFDPRSFGTWRASRASAEAAKIGTLAAKTEVQRAVVRAYYAVLGGASFVESARKSLDVAQKNLQLVKDRRTGGIASDLDVSRATADVSRAEGNVADAQLMFDLAVRGLQTATGLPPTDTSAVLSPDDLHEEAALAGWMAGGADSPEMRVAEANLHAAEVARDATHLAFIPTISGTAIEHVTNAPSLVPLNESYQLMLTASWRLDYSLIASIRQANALANVAKAQRDKTQLGSNDAIFEAWSRVRANITKARAARVALDAANEAVRISQERYTGGIATQLDVVTAERDAFQADVARISADADLQAARALLRLAAGRPLQANAGRTP